MRKEIRQRIWTILCILFLLCMACGCDRIREVNSDAILPPVAESSTAPKNSKISDGDVKPEPEPEPNREEDVSSNSKEKPPSEPADEDLVYIQDYIPTIFVDLRYATDNNFTGQVVYDFTEPQLRYGTVKKLAQVQEDLLSQGYSMKIWDAYRPVSAQFALWEAYPDALYVADPNKGYSTHSKGNTIDVTLVKADGTEIVMPTDFDDFSSLADRDYSDVPEAARLNVRVLEQTMMDHDFRCYAAEWWHYWDSTAYPVIQE